MKDSRVLAMGRFNPPTSGHALVMNTVAKIAKNNDADHTVILSKSQDKKKNPLPVDKKVEFAKKIAPGVNVVAATSEHPTIMHHIQKAHDEGVQHLHIVAGSDRLEEYKNLVNKYQGKEGHYNFKSIKFHSSGERDPDAEGDSGISGTKMREHASNHDVESFRKGLPEHIDKATAEHMMTAVQHGMGLHEQTMISFKEYLAEQVKLTVDEQFDMIEEMISDLAEENYVDVEDMWDVVESIDDEELLEAAVDSKGHKSSTGGLTQKGRDYYNRKTGGNLKAPVTTPPSKLKSGSKAANRRKSFCARMSGVDGPMKKPNGEPTRKALALRKWNC